MDTSTPGCRIAIGAALLLLSTASFAFTAASARADGEPCAAESSTPTKKKGLGGLLGAVRNAGLMGSIESAARGDGDLGTSLADSAQASAQRTAEKKLACVGQQATVQQATVQQAEDGQPRTSQNAKTAQPQRVSKVAYPSDLPTPPDKAEEIKAYDALRYVRCTGCEGGEQDEGFHGDAFNPSRRQHIDITAMMEAMQPGESRTWSGSEIQGRITKIGEETQGGFRCMRFRLHIDRGKQSAERDKLYCWGRQNQFLIKERWVDVY